jgi:hypothetical protein
MGEIKAEEILESKEFSAFYKAAVDFCDFIENFKSNDKTEFLKATRTHLLNLYDKGLKLQWVELKSNIEYDVKIARDEFDQRLASIAERLEDSRFYWHVFDPTNEKDTEPGRGDLVDDLGDIYKDLKYSIMIFNLGKPECQENALWQFKFYFNKHWDDHCINALSAIHFFLEND